MQGYFAEMILTTAQKETIKLALITRRAWPKGGTRFRDRGVNMNGDVANYCETE